MTDSNVKADMATPPGKPGAGEGPVDADHPASAPVPPLTLGQAADLIARLEWPEHEAIPE